MKIFVSDYDGTFSKPGGSRSEIEKNIEQVEIWRNAGNMFVFATGRSISTMTKYTPPHIAYDYLVSLNGGVIATATNEMLYQEVISCGVAQEIMALIQELGFGSYTISDGRFDYRRVRPRDYGENIALPAWRRLLLRLSPPSPLRWNNPRYRAAMARPIAQIAIKTTDSKKAVDFARLVNERFHGQASAYVNTTAVDIGGYGVSKAAGIDYLRDLLGAEHSQIYCMGDSFNDIPMLEAYRGFTLPEAPDEVKARAKGVYPTVGDAIQALL